MGGDREADRLVLALGGDRDRVVIALVLAVLALVGVLHALGLQVVRAVLLTALAVHQVLHRLYRNLQPQRLVLSLDLQLPQILPIAIVQGDGYGGDRLPPRPLHCILLHHHLLLQVMLHHLPQDRLFPFLFLCPYRAIAALLRMLFPEPIPPLILLNHHLLVAI
ncbi:hypothetical protein BI308_12820 [Roseofilum reptotaenium AO1-A]|uniref:Uncharacterized protein n=1 Tax=Roseofilum reptotaenium AO1-A TaxID=1925591 RepID=A0A1L9QRG3_9CYAN|nr:hypothetical protein BI308_12820 [Roseofilum reptotaenium AO1-A]